MVIFIILVTLGLLGLLLYGNTSTEHKPLTSEEQMLNSIKWAKTLAIKGEVANAIRVLDQAEKTRTSRMTLGSPPNPPELG
jgi:hypothetical protein